MRSAELHRNRRAITPEIAFALDVLNRHEKGLPVPQLSLYEEEIVLNVAAWKSYFQDGIRKRDEHIARRQADQRKAAQIRAHNRRSSQQTQAHG